MFDGLSLDRDRIYDAWELNFPTTGVAFACGDRDVRRPYIAFNMVSSVDGKATTGSGGLAGLGSRADRRVMQVLRSRVDAVLAGGGTLRVDPFVPDVVPALAAERARDFPDRPHLLGIVVSNSGNLPLNHRFWDAGPERRIVFLGREASNEAEAALRQRAQVWRLPLAACGTKPDLAPMLELLYGSLGVTRLLVEGGPSLNFDLLANGWGDELFLTLSPRLVGGVDNTTVLAGAGYGFGSEHLRHLELRSLYRHDSELFLRYRIVPPAQNAQAQLG